MQENSYASNDNDAGEQRTEFQVVPAGINWRPARTTPWPKTHGPQTAEVVGPEGESIWTDKYGRVKLKFRWDRHGNGNETSSCWVRVSSAWAGWKYGGIQIPRVGEEVVVDFINGDPDRPIITGRVYNEDSMPPWDLPGDATKMGFMSRSKGGGTDNASFLFLEDAPGNESFDMHAERNMNMTVENDKNVNIDGSRTTTIGRLQDDTVTGDATFLYKAKRTTTVNGLETANLNAHQTVNIKGGRDLTIIDGGDKIDITGNQSFKLDGAQTQDITQTQHVTVKGNQTLDITEGQQTSTINKGQTVNITAGGQHTTITAGGQTTTVTAGGQTLTVEAGGQTTDITGNVKETYKTISKRRLAVRSPSRQNHQHYQRGRRVYFGAHLERQLPWL